MPRFGGDDDDGGEDADHSHSFAEGDEALDPLDTTVDPDSAAQDANSDAASISGEVDALIVRTRRTLGAYNDLASEAGRNEIQLADPEYNEAGRLAEWLRVLNAQTSATLMGWTPPAPRHAGTIWWSSLNGHSREETSTCKLPRSA